MSIWMYYDLMINTAVFEILYDREIRNWKETPKTFLNFGEAGIPV